MRFSPGGIRVILVVVMSVSTGESTRAENFFWIVEEGTLYRIDVNDLAVTTVGNIGVEGSDYGGLAYDRSTDILYGLLDRRRDSILVEIDRLTGEATPIGSAAPDSPGAWFSGFDISPSSQAIARTLSRIGPEQETTSVALFHIDLTTGEATRKVAAPDILGRTDMAYASDGRLYDITRNRPDGPLLRLIDDETGGYEELASYPTE